MQRISCSSGCACVVSSQRCSYVYQGRLNLELVRSVGKNSCNVLIVPVKCMMHRAISRMQKLLMQYSADVVTTCAAT